MNKNNEVKMARIALKSACKFHEEATIAHDEAEFLLRDAWDYLEQACKKYCDLVGIPYTNKLSMCFSIDDIDKVINEMYSGGDSND